MSKCLTPDLRENAFSFSPLSMMLVVSLLYMDFFFNVRIYSFYAHFIEVFGHG